MDQIRTPADKSTFDLWRVGIVAYREAMRHGEDREAAGVQAMLDADPSLTIDEAKSHLTQAIAWVTRTHTAWFWSACPPADYEWPPRR